MIPHKTARGAAALERLKVFEGIPPAYSKQKRMVLPQALRVLRLHPSRKYTILKRLSHEFGWKYMDTVDELETKRKEAGKAYYVKKLRLAKLKREAEGKVSKELKSVNGELLKLGY